MSKRTHEELSTTSTKETYEYQDNIDTSVIVLLTDLQKKLLERRERTIFELYVEGKKRLVDSATYVKDANKMLVDFQTRLARMVDIRERVPSKRFPTQSVVDPFKVNSANLLKELEQLSETFDLKYRNVAEDMINLFVKRKKDRMAKYHASTREIIEKYPLTYFCTDEEFTKLKLLSEIKILQRCMSYVTKKSQFFYQSIGNTVINEYIKRDAFKDL
jgi:hypothetical protein